MLLNLQFFQTDKGCSAFRPDQKAAARGRSLPPGQEWRLGWARTQTSSGGA